MGMNVNKIILLILRYIFKFFMNIKISGIENININEKKIYICNHQSVVDAIIIFLFIPDNFVFVMDKVVGTKQPIKLSHFTSIANFKKLVINRVAQFIVKFSDVIKVNSKSPHSIKDMITAVNQGKSLMIFPEGKITLTGNLEPISDGVGMVAEKTNATIIPMKLDGLLETYFSYMNIKKKIFSNVTLKIDKPFNFCYDENMTTKEKRNYRISEIEKRIS